MNRWHPGARLAAMIAVLLILTGFAPAAAQEAAPATEVRLLTPYVGVAVEPGDTSSFNLELLAPPGEEVDFEVADIPTGWDARIRGGGYVVDRVQVDEALNLNLRLEVDVPTTASEGEYTVTLLARGATTSDRIDFRLDVADAVGGGASLNADFPALRGPSDVEFSFTLELANDTGEEIQFGLQGQGPTGWQVTTRPTGQSLASSVTVAPGSSQRVNVQVDPPDYTPAGVYNVTVQAAGGGETASTDLVVEITGNFDLSLVTPDERLNVDVEAGKATELPLLVLNQGTAPLEGVSLSATPPRGWEVTYSPDTIDRVEPGGSAEVTAIITPADDAIAGDYRLTMRSSVPEANDSIEVRATVKTSALWGFVGVIVILAALGALGFVFRRFGRR